MSFSQPYVSKRSSKNAFLKQINEVIDWESIVKILQKHYPKGLRPDGRPAYNPIILFKMLLLGVWYKSLSDRDIEDRTNTDLSWMTFVGLSLEDEVPDHSTLCRFRNELAGSNAYDLLLQELNQQLDKHAITVKSGCIIDASITDSPRKPTGKPTYEIAEDRKENEQTEEAIQTQTAELKLVKVNQPGVDDEARWLKKGKETRFGYKKHVITDGNGLVLALETTPANVHDHNHFNTLITKAQVPPKVAIYADKAYKSKAHTSYLKAKGLKDRVCYKAVKNKPLTKLQLKFNQLCGKHRYKIERTFAGTKSWFGGGTARYVGIAKTHAQHALEAIAYNLYRLPKLLVNNMLTPKTAPPQMQLF